MMENPPTAKILASSSRRSSGVHSWQLTGPSLIRESASVAAVPTGLGRVDEVGTRRRVLLFGCNRVDFPEDLLYRAFASMASAYIINKVYLFSQIFKSIGEITMSAHFERARREPVPRGDIVRGLVAFRDAARLFQITTRIGHETYDIEADRILTHRSFVDWVWQLQSKTWMSGQHFSDFFDCLSDFIYRQWGDCPQEFYDVIWAGDDPDRV